MTEFEEIEIDVHPAVIERLQWEASLLPGTAAEHVLGVRLSMGLRSLEMGTTRPFWWVIPAVKTKYCVMLPQGVGQSLNEWASWLKYPLEVLVHAFATARECEPVEVRTARVELGVKPPRHGAIPITDADSSGSPDLGPHGSSLESILWSEGVRDFAEIASCLLAREIARTGRCGGVRVSDSARTFARQVADELTSRRQ